MKSGGKWVRSFFIFALVFFGAHSFSQPFESLSLKELGELLVETSECNYELNAIEELAQKAGFQVATYGGTSREKIDFARAKVEELGGVRQYRAWLKTKPRIHLHDWHRMNSDLDIMIISGEKGALSPEIKKKLDALKVQIAEEFPGNIFYKNLDITVAEEFLRDPRFRPSGEHYEAISNIPLGRKGILELDDLNVTTKNGKTNLARWGAEQYLKGVFEFELNPDFKAREPAFAKLKQVLRWIRYASENPNIKLAPQAEQQIGELISDLEKNHKQQVLDLFKAGNAELVAEFMGKNPTASTLGGKIIEALEKAQLYSGDSIKTRELLDRF